MPLPDTPPAPDRGYVVVWSDQDDHENPITGDTADDIHRTLGGAVRILMRGDHSLFEEHEKSIAKTLVEPLLLLRKISIYTWNFSYSWTIHSPRASHVVLAEKVNNKLLLMAFDEAVKRIFPDVPYQERLNVNNLYFEEFREPEDVPLNWHELLYQAKQGGNQGRRPRAEGARTASPGMAEPPSLAEDGLTFTNRGELAVYRALKEIQANLKPHETIGIYPLPGARVLNQTFEPDLLVTYKGRVGIIEIDGPKHRGRYVNDRSRDRLFTNSGVHIVERLGAEEVSNPDDLSTFLQIFINRLAK